MNFLRSFFMIWVLVIACSVAFGQVDPAPAANPYVLYFGVVMGCLFAISEALALIPAIKANSVFQLLANIIKTLAGK